MHKGVIESSRGTIAARWIVSNREGGFSQPPYDSLNLASHVGDAPLAVAANRAILAGALELSADRMVYPGLIHSTDVGWVDSPVGLFPNVDVLITTKRNIGLVTMGADCVPLIAVEPLTKVALVAHIGWRGAADGIVESLITSLSTAGADLSQTQVVLGPSICGNCYAVDAERREAVLGVLPAAGTRSESGLDLRDGIQAALTAKKLKVSRVGGCTAEEPQLFSHRRDGITGRQAAAVVLS